MSVLKLCHCERNNSFSTYSMVDIFLLCKLLFYNGNFLMLVVKRKLQKTLFK